MTRTKIPACHGKAARLKKGEVIKVSQPVADEFGSNGARLPGAAERRHMCVPYMERMGDEVSIDAAG